MAKAGRGAAPNGSDTRANRGDKLRIQAKTWNDLQQMKKEWMRNKRKVGQQDEYTSEVNPQLTVLVENKTGADIKAFRAYRVSGVTVNPANHPYSFNKRPAVQIEVVNDATNAIAITLSPIEDDKINRGVIKGYCVCRVKINDADHDWAVPVDGETYLESAESGPARILWFGVVTDSAESGESVESGEDSTPDELSGEEISGSGEDADIYWALVDLIGSSAVSSGGRFWTSGGGTGTQSETITAHSTAFDFGDAMLLVPAGNDFVRIRLRELPIKLTPGSTGFNSATRLFMVSMYLVECDSSGVETGVGSYDNGINSIAWNENPLTGANSPVDGTYTSYPDAGRGIVRFERIVSPSPLADRYYRIRAKVYIFPTTGLSPPFAMTLSSSGLGGADTDVILTAELLTENAGYQALQIAAP